MNFNQNQPRCRQSVNLFNSLRQNTSFITRIYYILKYHYNPLGEEKHAIKITNNSGYLSLLFYLYDRYLMVIYKQRAYLSCITKINGGNVFINSTTLLIIFCLLGNVYFSRCLNMDVVN